mgnify:CR=1 FL=1
MVKDLNLQINDTQTSIDKTTAKIEDSQAQISAILNAVYQRIADNRGTWNTTCGSATVTLPSATTTIGTDAANINLEACLVPPYLPSMSLDPLPGVATSTGYTIIRYASGRIAVSALVPELGEVISVLR